MKRVLVFVLICFAFGQEAQVQTIGLISNDKASFNGYTLFSPTAAKETFLIDNCGRLINKWQSLHNPGMIAYLLEDGSLLRTASIDADGFNGGGIGGRIEKFSWEGDLLWTYDVASSTLHQHHDIAPLPNGNILVIAWEKIPAAVVLEKGRDPERLPANGLWSEKIIELKPIGSNQAEVVWEWNLLDHVVQDFDDTKSTYGVISEHPELLDINFLGTVIPVGNPQSDWVHLNSVDYNSDLDQIILSSRTMSEVWIIDHSTTTEEAASHSGGNSGKGGDFLYRWGNPIVYNRASQSLRQLYSQHDAHWIPAGVPGAGNLMVFNNNGPSSVIGNQSQIIEWETPKDENANYLLNDEIFGPKEYDWFYGGVEEHIDFFSARISGAQRLSNGNTLICDGDSGRFIEIDTEGNLVWEYINPFRAGFALNQGEDPRMNHVFRVYKYATDYPAFAGRDLSPGPVLEANPLDFNCEIYDEVSVRYNTLDGVSINGNPVGEEFVLANQSGEILSYSLFSLSGNFILADNLPIGQISVNVSENPSGMYILRIENEKGTKFSNFKLIKL